MFRGAVARPLWRMLGVRNSGCNWRCLEGRRAVGRFRWKLGQSSSPKFKPPAMPHDAPRKCMTQPLWFSDILHSRARISIVVHFNSANVCSFGCEPIATQVAGGSLYTLSEQQLVDRSFAGACRRFHLSKANPMIICANIFVGSSARCKVWLLREAPAV